MKRLPEARTCLWSHGGSQSRPGAESLPPCDLTLHSSCPRTCPPTQDKHRAGWGRWAMSLQPTTLLGLVLCLGQRIHTQEGALPRPSISAEPGSVVPRGRPVTIVCRGPAGAETFRLQKKGSRLYWDKRSTSPSEPEARFLFSMSEYTAGSYSCSSYRKSTWSELSEDLELVLSREDATQAPTPVPAQSSGAPRDVSVPPTEAGSLTAPTLQSYMGLNCVRLGLAGLVLVILLAILGEAWHSWLRSQKEGDTRHRV